MSDYIMDLRKEVGHRPILQLGASVIVINDKGQILLEKRSDTHNYSYPGGSVELGEKVEEAAQREMYEEVGLIANKLEFFTIASGEELHFKYPNGDEVFNVDIVYLCRDYSGTLKAEESEVEGLGWYDIDNLPEIFSPNVPVINLYLKSIVK